jgi:hypothetical protein
VTRKLTIRTKLAAALAVPLVILAAFSGLRVRDAFDRSDAVKRQAALATATTGPAGLLSALQAERDYQSLWEMGKQGLVDPELQTSADATARTNVALLRYRQTVVDLGRAAADIYGSTLASFNSKLAGLRKDAQTHASKVANAATAKQANRVFDRYTALIDQLLDTDQKAGATIRCAAARRR